MHLLRFLNQSRCADRPAAQGFLHRRPRRSRRREIRVSLIQTNLCDLCGLLCKVRFGLLVHDSFLVLASGVLIAASLASCDWMPGKPKEADIWKPASENRDFASLYESNCLGCHSNGKTFGASLAMNNPLYLAVIPRDALHKIIAEGVPGSLMPAFSHSRGRELIDAQVDVLTDGIYKWGPGKVDPGLPPYSAVSGDANRGTTVFNNFCAKCHGSDGKGGPSGSVVDQDYLRLVSDQYLRSVVIAGRPEFGMPDFRHNDPNRPMSPEDVSDVVAWMSKQRNSEASTGEQQASINGGRH
jgi:cytochrome c oxidase cbb3-type subunit III